MTPQSFHILVALADRDLHGYAIMRDIAERTSGKIQLRAGTLYGAIQRLLEQGLVTELPVTEGSERRRSYRLTPAGRRAAKAETARLTELVNYARSHGLAPKRA